MVMELSQFDPTPFDPDTAPLEVVWDWLCERVAGLRESGGLGTPPDKSGPLSYCEGRLYHLLEEAIGITPVWSCASLSAFAPADECWVIVDIRGGYTLGDIVAPSGRGEARCAWGDPEREPTKEARLRAAADLVVRVSREKKP